jgi:hypothetical protein
MLPLNDQRECMAWALLAWLQPLRMAQTRRIARLGEVLQEMKAVGHLGGACGAPARAPSIEAFIGSLVRMVTPVCSRNQWASVSASRSWSSATGRRCPKSTRILP